MVRVSSLLVAFLVGPAAHADPFWVEYNANVLPELDGWNRVFESPGGSRSVSGGIFTLNTLGAPGVYDFNARPAVATLGLGEEFRYEWRTRVTGDLHDTWVNIGQGASFGTVGVSIGASLVQVGPNDFVWIPPGVFHDYRLSSSNMRDFDLFIDGALASSFPRTSVLGPSITLVFGDWTTGSAGTPTSRSEWDYVRFGVVPEPATVLLLAAGAALATARRRVG